MTTSVSPSSTTAVTVISDVRVTSVAGDEVVVIGIVAAGVGLALLLPLLLRYEVLEDVRVELASEVDGTTVELVVDENVEFDGIDGIEGDDVADALELELVTTGTNERLSEYEIAGMGVGTTKMLMEEVLPFPVLVLEDTLESDNGDEDVVVMLALLLLEIDVMLVTATPAPVGMTMVERAPAMLMLLPLLIVAMVFEEVELVVDVLDEIDVLDATLVDVEELRYMDVLVETIVDVVAIAEVVTTTAPLSIPPVEGVVAKARGALEKAVRDR